MRVRTRMLFISWWPLRFYEPHATDENTRKTFFLRFKQEQKYWDQNRAQSEMNENTIKNQISEFSKALFDLDHCSEIFSRGIDST